jgi:predicted outer membrane protein
MTLLIIALGMTATMGFYALHLAEMENAKMRLETSRIKKVSEFASM